MYYLSKASELIKPTSENEVWFLLQTNIQNCIMYINMLIKKKQRSTSSPLLFPFIAILLHGCYHMVECPNHRIYQKRFAQTKTEEHWRIWGSLQGELRYFIPFPSASSARVAPPALRFCSYHFANQWPLNLFHADRHS